MPKNDNIEKIYQKLTQREHIYKLPDTYIGSIEKNEESIWMIDNNISKMTKKNMTYISGFYKIFDELVVNAYDQYVRLLQKSKETSNINFVKNIKFNIDKETGIISVYNDGDGIDVEMHKEHKMYVPSLIFGELLTGTNYDDDDNPQEKLTGGKNGYGAKLANIFANEFTIETVDAYRKKKFIQTFRNNMTTSDEPVVSKCTSKPYTKITFLPDYKRFGLKKLSEDMYHLFAKRAFDISACTDPTVSIYFNNEKINCKSFEKYTTLFLPNEHEIVHEKINNRWEVVVATSPNDTFQQISFVNGIFTSKGGKHVEYVVNTLCKKLSEYISKKKKITIKPNYIKENLMIFVKSNIINPSFDSQTKDYLTTNASKFGSKCDLDDKYIERVAKCGIMEKAIELYEFKENRKLKTEDGKKTNKIYGIPKLDDANFAGGPKSKDCILVLTEGDSAKTTAIAGLSEVDANYYGVFPLRGKVINVKEKISTLAGKKTIMTNEEIKSIIKILGLQIEGKYQTIDKLRYGQIMIMTDQDVDGSHIKGLLINVFHTLWPDLLKINKSFLTALATPIVKVKKAKNEIVFYNLTDYDNWKDNNNNGKGWTTKYYKGLGTSTKTEAKEYFANMHITNYKHTDETDASINLAFNKDQSDDRKEWLKTYDKNVIVNPDELEVSFTDFVNKELKHFSNYDNARSIPSVCDGFKPSQRKVMFSCFKRNLKQDLKVSQLAGYVSEHSAYHHGETSLLGTMIGMAHDFVGSNNINLLFPSGQFGTRLQGGHDNASPRYIFTRLEEITEILFNKNDNTILNYLDDDGLSIEPEYYVPILPVVLFNGAQGIGTGFSTTIPCYNPLDLCDYIENKIDDEDVPDLHPWYNGFKGKIIKCGKDSYITKGTYKLINYNTIEITELPIGTWTENYKAFLDFECDEVGRRKKNAEKLKENPKYKPKESYIKDYSKVLSDTMISFTVEFKGNSLKTLMKEGKLEKELNLTSRIATTNMHLFNKNGQIQKYTVDEIMDEFFEVRMEHYEIRRKYMLKDLKQLMKVLNEKVRFINDVIKGVIIVNNRGRDNINKQLEDKEYMKVDDDYKYLTSMPIFNLSAEKKQNLEDEASKKSEEYNELKNLTPSDLWRNELKVFKQVYSKYLATRAKANEAPIKKAPKGGKAKAKAIMSKTANKATNKKVKEI
jgi:DNA topoisomerase-2